MGYEEDEYGAEVRQTAEDLAAIYERMEKEAKTRRKQRSDYGLPILSAEDMLAELGPIPWVVPALKMAPGLPVLFAGYGYSGKTISAQSILVSVASGRPVWGLWSVEAGAVGHLDWEQGKRTTVSRYQRLARDMGADLGDLMRRGMFRVSVFPGLRINQKDAEDILVRFCTGLKVCLLDSLTAALTGIDENSAAVGEFLYMLGRVSERTGCVIVLVHHSRKPQEGDDGDPRRAIRGSTAIYNGCSGVFVLLGKKGEPTCWYHEKERNEGQTLAPFWTQVEDTQDGRGVRIVHMDKEQLPTGGRRDAFAEAKLRILEAAKAYPRSSQRKLLAIAKGKKDIAVLAFHELLEAGALREVGKQEYIAC